MKTSIVLGVAGIAIAAGMLGLGYVAGRTTTPTDAVAATSGTTDRAAVEGIVRDYLIRNPEIMLDVQTALETRQRERQRGEQLAAIQSDSNEIFNADYDGIVGNPDGAVTIVEFYDYNCGYCKRALTDMDALVEADGDLRFVLKEFPILGPDSRRAHVVSMAFRTLEPELYGDFHRRLMASEARATEETAISVAIELGADEDALRAEMANPAIEKAFATTYELADRLAITGTPSYVLGDEVVFGALGQAVLAEKVSNLKTCQSTVC
jgi:protein-disulfide isomerase